MEAVNRFKLSAIVYTKLHHRLLDAFCPSIDSPRIRIAGDKEFGICCYCLSAYVCLALICSRLNSPPKKELNFSSFNGLGLSEN